MGRAHSTSVLDVGNITMHLLFDLDGTWSDKALLIDHILKRDATDPSSVVMIGDRKHDMVGARQNGVAGLGVLWGYGSQTELEAAGAYACAAAPSDLVALINKKPN